MFDNLPQNIFLLPPFVLYAIAIVASFIISIYAVKKVIFITSHRRIYDIPDDIRKFHGGQIPSLGGVGIFMGYIIVASFFILNEPKGWNFMTASTVILFFTGIYDDLMNMRPNRKLMIQLLASFITVYLADIRITSFEGILGIGTLGYWVSISITTFFCTFFINVFNFIDGIDGLACVTAIYYSIILGALFAVIGHISLACIAFCLVGATLGLLYYNKAPAKIYMGDTGSLVLGFCIFVFSVQVVNCGNIAANTPALNRNLAFMLNSQKLLLFVFSLLYLPIFDAIHVFIIRVAKGVSPFKADRNHLHYLLLDAGFKHTQSVLILLITNILNLSIGYMLQNKHSLDTIACVTVFDLFVLAAIYKLRKKRKNIICA